MNMSALSVDTVTINGVNIKLFNTAISTNTIYVDFAQNTFMPTMNLAQKIGRLQEISEAPTFTRFAELVGVNAVTLHRMESLGTATERIYERLADAYDGLTIDDLRDDERELPEGISLSVHHREHLQREMADSGVVHEGQMLKNYLKKAHIKQSDLADALKVSREQVHSYLKSTRFRPHVRQNVLDALGASEAQVFGNKLSRTAPAKATGVPMLALPLLKPAMRQVTPDALKTFRSGFMVTPDMTFYLHADLIAAQPDELPDLVAIEVIETDHLIPAFHTGAVVLARALDAADWAGISESVVAVLVDGRLKLRQVYRNDLRTSNVLEIGPIDRARGGTQTLRKDDIQVLFLVTNILFSPA